MRQIKGRPSTTLAFLILCVAPAMSAFAQQAPGTDMREFGVDSINLHIELTSLRTGGPPRVVEEKVLFTYKPEGRGITGPRFTRYVGVAFEHENYSTVHVFARNDHDVFFFLYPIPTDGSVSTLRYRYVVDGLWLPDPENPNRIQDVAGIAVSYVVIPAPQPERGDLPRIDSDGRVLFVYRGTANAVVSIAGSFSNWDPYMHRLSEVAPGEYRIRLRLPPSVHTYYYVVNGRRVLDPLNPDLAYDNDGNPASRFVVPPSIALSP